MNKKRAAEYVQSILLEQDMDSPHKYLYSKQDIAGRALADIGAAEGFFSLDVIDDVKKVYLFECDAEWVEALKLTFAPWKDKVQIVEKYVGEHDGDESISLDNFFVDLDLDFIKADIEGFEVSMLLGAKKTLEKVSKIIVCAYHRQDAEKEIKKILGEYGFNITTSNGYMFFLDDKNQYAPYLRRGLVYADK